MEWAFIVLAALCLALPGRGQAQADFTTPGQFQLVAPCMAYTSIRRGTGETALQLNATYPAYAENRAREGSHVLIAAGGKRKWLSLACGHYVGAKPPFARPIQAVSPLPAQEESCLPFFDAEQSTVEVGVGGRVDVTPPAPEIEPFGAALNRLCGAAGTPTRSDGFKAVLQAHPAVLTAVMDYTGGKVFASRPAQENRADYLNDLAEAWYAAGAFDHIYCGEPESAGRIGGLHYHGRYQQLQERGEGCRLPNYPRNEVLPGRIYTVGVRMKRADGGWARSDIKGYGLTLSAADILQVATRAFSENPVTSKRSDGCLLTIDDAGVPFKAVFVRRAAGIRTLYPDATPDDRHTPACSRSVVLDGSAVR